MVVSCNVYADEQPLRFTDPEDGQLDMSDFLLKHKGALPVPVVITEPAIGYGLGLGLLFFSGPITGTGSESMDDNFSEFAPSGEAGLAGCLHGRTKFRSAKGVCEANAVRDLIT